MDAHRKATRPGHSRSHHSELTRREAVGRLLRGAILVHPLGWRALSIDPQVLAGVQERQPFMASVRRLVEAMAYMGEPFSETDQARLDAAANRRDVVDLVAEIERVLDARSLVTVRINPESRVSVERGAALPRLVEQGWRAFLVKVQNEAGVTGALTMESPQARPVYRRSTGAGSG